MFPVVGKCGSLTAGFWQPPFATCANIKFGYQICCCGGKKVASSVSSESLPLTPPLQSAVRSTEHTLNTQSLPFNGTDLSEIHWGFLFIEEFTIGLLFLTKATFKVDVLCLYPAPFLFLDSVRVALHDKINACLSYSAAPQFILWLPFRPRFFFVFTPNTQNFLSVINY